VTDPGKHLGIRNRRATSRGAENGRSVILGVGIGVAAIGGWQLWNKHTISQSRQASDGYEQTLRAMSGEGDVGELAKKVRDDHDDSLYASLAAMAAARGFVEQGKLEEAGKELSWTASNAPDKQVALIARIRLAHLNHLPRWSKKCAAIFTLPRGTRIRPSLLIKQRLIVDRMLAIVRYSP